MFKKNRTVWGIASLVCSYLSLFIAVAFIGENKRVSLKMLLMSITQLICGDGSHVPTKFVVGAVGAAFCFITSFPIYMSKDKK